MMTSSNSGMLKRRRRAATNHQGRRPRLSVSIVTCLMCLFVISSPNIASASTSLGLVASSSPHHINPENTLRGKHLRATFLRRNLHSDDDGDEDASPPANQNNVEPLEIPENGDDAEGKNKHGVETASEESLETTLTATNSNNGDGEMVETTAEAHEHHQHAAANEASSSTTQEEGHNKDEHAHHHAHDDADTTSHADNRGGDPRNSKKGDNTHHHHDNNNNNKDASSSTATAQAALPLPVNEFLNKNNHEQATMHQNDAEPVIYDTTSSSSTTTEKTMVQDQLKASLEDGTNTSSSTLHTTTPGIVVTPVMLVGMGLAAILGMLFTAWQMADHPDGLYASLCRGTLSVVGMILHILLVPFRCCCGGLIKRSQQRPYAGHVRVSTMDYGYKDPSLQFS